MICRFWPLGNWADQYDWMPVSSGFSISESTPEPFVDQTPSSPAKIRLLSHVTIERASRQPTPATGCSCMSEPSSAGGTPPRMRSTCCAEKIKRTPPMVPRPVMS
jgi:hypothetical protein